MTLKRFMISGLLGIVAGVLGNLVSAIIENSVGEFTKFQLAGMIISIIFTQFLIYQNNKDTLETRKAEEKMERIENLRQELKLLQSKYESGVLWTERDVETWLIYQREIEEIKRELRLQNSNFYIPTNPLDYAKPPSIGCLGRIISLVKQSATLLTVLLVFTLSLSISFSLTPTIHSIFLSLMGTGTPSLTSTPSPVETPTPTLITQTLTQTPQASLFPEIINTITPEPPIENQSITPTLLSITSTPSTILPSVLTPTPTEKSVITITINNNSKNQWVCIDILSPSTGFSVSWECIYSNKSVVYWSNNVYHQIRLSVYAPKSITEVSNQLVLDRVVTSSITINVLNDGKYQITQD